jgi:hypothetical protein
MEYWLEEFTYRGRPPSGEGSESPPEYHVRIGFQQPDPFNPDGSMKRSISDALTPARAEAAGWPLSMVVKAINAETLKALDAATTEVAALREALEEKSSQVTDLTAMVQQIQESSNGNPKA